MKTQDFINLENKYVAHNYHPLDIVISHGHGIWVYDIEGKKYMDFLSGYSAVNQGHTHQKILDTAISQMKKITHTSRAFRHDQLGLFSKELCEAAGFEMMIPMNSGAEAIETALKLARKWGYQVKKVAKEQAEIIVCGNNFHGRTITTISFSTENLYRDEFGPFTSGFKIIPFNDIPAFKKALTKNTVAVLVEPIQGEGGIIIPDNGYLTQLKSICKKEHVLLMLDEIQTGFGRTGKLFAYQHEEDAKPDILIVGKALGGGFYPISAVLSSRDLLLLLKPGGHGSTFGGNPLACGIGRASLQVILEEKLSEKSLQLGNYLVEKLQTMQSDFIQEIRGKGLFIGIELTKQAGGARRFCELLLTEGILCKETRENVLRLAPPLVITKEELDWAFERIKKVLEGN